MTAADIDTLREITIEVFETITIVVKGYFVPVPKPVFGK